jgi:cation diffusion facilitator family transporter
VTLLGFKLAEKPADEDHPYGHARYEYLSALAVAAMILFIGFELAKTSVVKIITPEATEFTWLTAGILLFSIGVKLWLSFYNRRLGKKIASDALLAAAADSRNDVIATGVVLISGVVEYLTGWKVDAWMGLGVALFILYSGIGMARSTISPLLGEAATPELRNQLLDKIQSEPKVLGYHDLMVHDYGPGRRFASVHVEMDRREDPLLCHEIIDDLERECFERLGTRLVIHYDPVVTNDPKLDRMRTLVTAILKVRDERLSIHDFRMVPGSGHTNIIFDVALPMELRGQEKTIQAALETALNDLGEEKFYTVITFDHAAFN